MIRARARWFFFFLGVGLAGAACATSPVDPLSDVANEAPEPHVTLDASADRASRMSPTTGDAGLDAPVADAKTEASPSTSLPDGGWSWVGSTTAGWTISNSGPGGAALDCCGCGAMCAACVDDTTMTSAGSVASFGSGLVQSGGMNHFRDGFTSWLHGIPVTAGKGHVLSTDITGLDAHITGSTGVEPYRPTWTLQIFEGASPIATTTGSWGTAQCASCMGQPSDLGVKSVAFVPTGSTVDVALTATHGSSQCASEAYGVTVRLAWLNVKEQ